jgi:hypothetical protein
LLTTITSPTLNRNSDPDLLEQPTVAELQQRFVEQTNDVMAFAREPREQGTKEETTFKAFEAELIPMVFALGRTLVMLFLAAAEERVTRRTPERMRRAGRRFRKVEAKGRNLQCWFGVVRYWRTYMAEVADDDRRGFHPLDLALALTKDRLSMLLLSICVRLATKLSFSQARSTALWFLPAAPSTEVIEQATLGFGRFTGEWFERRPAPDGDGDVLVILIDSKGVPTATLRELRKRRGKRRKARVPKSQRHRGRQRRARWSPKQRRNKGDKSKNAKMATLVVMYTLKRQGRYLVGPINRWVYGSFAPKKHAFVIARREANKRGFAYGSGKQVQLLTDGDPDLEQYGKTYFPEATHTLDVMHVVEKLWEAGACIHPEGSDALKEWVELQKQWLYGGQVNAIIGELVRHWAETPKTGPGNKGKRQRLKQILTYLKKRTTMMNYDELLAEDLEISTGQIEGAVKYVLGLRCDHGGMRWIKERAEAILQLRCIDINGDWDAFVDYVHDSAQRQAMEQGHPVRIQQQDPDELPEVTEQAV